MRHGMRFGILMCVAGLLVFAGVVLAQGKEEERPRPKPEAPPPGPAVKMKVIEFVTLETQGILRFQFLDRKGNATEAPEGGELNYTTSITKPRKGSLPMSKAIWKPKEKEYVLTGLAQRQQYVCPPRSYTINVHFKAGKRQMRASLTTKINCI